MSSLTPRIHIWEPPSWGKYDTSITQMGAPWTNPSTGWTANTTGNDNRYRYSWLWGVYGRAWGDNYVSGGGSTSFTNGFKLSVPTADIVSLEMVLRVNEISSWRATIQYDPQNPAFEVRGLIEDLDDQGLIAQVWFEDEHNPSTRDNDGANVRRQLRPHLQQSVFGNGFANTGFPTSNAQGSDRFSGWMRTGMMGPLTGAILEHDSREGRLVLEGACVFQWLDDTIHWDFPTLLADGTFEDIDYTDRTAGFRGVRTGTIDVTRLIRELLRRNAEMPLSVTTTETSYPDIPEHNAGRWLSQASLESFATGEGWSWNDLIPTQIGRYRLRPWFDPESSSYLRGSWNTHLGANSEINFTPGAHSVLDTLKQIWEHAGMLAFGVTPAIPMVVERNPSEGTLLSNRMFSGEMPNKRIYWSHPQIRSASLGYKRPEATLWNVRHRFRGSEGDIRNWEYRLLNQTPSGQGNIQKWGAIMRQEVSSAPADELETQYPTDADIARAQRYVEAQVARDGRSQAAELDLAIEINNDVAGARWGKDWAIGSIVNIDLFPDTADTAGKILNATIREVAVSYSGTGEYSITCGFSPYTHLIPPPLPIEPAPHNPAAEVLPGQGEVKYNRVRSNSASPVIGTSSHSAGQTRHSETGLLADRLYRERHGDPTPRPRPMTSAEFADEQEADRR